MDEQTTEDGKHHLTTSLEGTQPMFSSFTVWEKRWIIFLAAFAGFFSPMSSFIFYPATDSISHSLHVDVGLVNLAITTYMVVSGIVPALIGNAADNLGRRPLYIAVLSIYFMSNIGLALQSSFPALLVLRMLQSAGSSGTRWFPSQSLRRHVRGKLYIYSLANLDTNLQVQYLWGMGSFLISRHELREAHM